MSQASSEAISGSGPVIFNDTKAAWLPWVVVGVVVIVGFWLFKRSK